MTGLDSQPEEYQYGLTPHGIQNVQASFVGMTQAERARMHVALLSILGRMLLDIAGAVTAALVELREEDVEVPIEEPEREEQGLMQTSKAKHTSPGPLPDHKVKQASTVVEMESILGSERDRMARSLISSMERMRLDEARRCAQTLLQRMLERYGSPPRPLDALPDDVQEMVAGFVTFGAEVGVEVNVGELTSMDEYFVSHWWGLLMPLLSPAQDETRQQRAVSGVVNDEDTIPLRDVMSGALPGRNVGVPSASEDNMAPNEGGTAAAFPLRPADGVIDLDNATTVGLRNPDGVSNTRGGDEGNCHAALVDVPVVVNADVLHRDMLLACEELKAAAYRDWEAWEMDYAMGNVGGHLQELCVRGVVRHQHGGQGTGQSMLFHLAPGERVDLQVYGPRSRRLQGTPSTSDAAVQTEAP